MKRKAKRKHNCWRVVIVYTDNETSGNRVFKDLDRAMRWAARQEKSNVVKKCQIESFWEPYHGVNHVKFVYRLLCLGRRNFLIYRSNQGFGRKMVNLQFV